MNGRMGQDFSSEDMAWLWNARAVRADNAPRFNVRSGSLLRAICARRDGDKIQRVLTGLRWGLIPRTASVEDVRAGHRLVWARREGLTQRAAFRDSLQRRRCVVPVTGWFARVRETFSDEAACEHHLWLRPRDNRMWSLAGVWDEWTDEDERVRRTCALVSTAPNARLERLGVRMPAILDEDAARVWLDGREHSGKYLQTLAGTIASRDMEISVVSAPRWREQDDESLLQPLSDSQEILQRLGLARERKAPAMRRQLRRDWRSDDGQIFFKMRSLTRDDDTRWHPVVDTGDGRVFCDCPDFHYRHARFRPDVWIAAALVQTPRTRGQQLCETRRFNRSVKTKNENALLQVLAGRFCVLMARLTGVGARKSAQSRRRDLRHESRAQKFAPIASPARRADEQAPDNFLRAAK